MNEMSVTKSRRLDLKCLTSDRIQKAFEKVRSEISVSDGKLVLITSEYYHQALRLLKQDFVNDEPMAIAFDMQWDVNAVNFWKDVFNEDMSIGIFDENAKELIAVRGMKVIFDGDENDNDAGDIVMDERLKHGMDFMKYCDDKAHFFQHFNTDVAIHFLGLCVAKEHRKKGLGAKLFEAALKFIQYFELTRVCVKGEGSSNFSKRIYEKFGFETLHEQKFKDYGKEQDITVRDTGEHKIYKAYGKCVLDPVD